MPAKQNMHSNAAIVHAETPTLSPWARDLPLWGEFSKISRLSLIFSRSIISVLDKKYQKHKLMNAFCKSPVWKVVQAGESPV